MSLSQDELLAQADEPREEGRDKEPSLMAARRAEYRYRLILGPDVDLERDDVRDSKGNRITEEYVRRAVADVHERLDGRSRRGDSNP